MHVRTTQEKEEGIALCLLPLRWETLITELTDP